MGVFNAAQNQVLFSPVTEYYKGKAIRTQQAAAEQQQELRGLQIEGAKQELADAPAKQKAAEAKAALDYANSLATLREKNTKNDIAERDQAADIVGPWIVEAKKRGVGWANSSFQEMVVDRLPKSKQEEFAGAAGPDHVFSEDEMAQIGLQIAVHKVDQDPDPTSHQKMIGDLVERGVLSRADGDQILVDIEKKAATITGTTEFDPGADPRTGSQQGAAYQEHLNTYNTSSDVQEMITSALPQIVATPGAVGIRGAVAAGGSGLFSALGQEAMANAFSQYMSGSSPEEIAQLQTELQVIRGRIIPIVTGEQGKRLSETEREIASKAVGIIEGIKGPADLTKAYPQVIGAMRQLYAESWASKYRIASQDENIEYPYDLSDRDQMVELLTEFSEAGVDPDTAKRTMIRMRSIQGVE